ncbi:MAG: mtnA [Ramlibacter sp.]|nr:mtnA [Ramlibacter sp.]
MRRLWCCRNVRLILGYCALCEHEAHLKIDGRPYRSITLAPDGWSVEVIDQTRLPFRLVIARLATCEAVAAAISQMVVRGAPLIGATAAYGVALAMRKDPGDPALASALETLGATRPTAVNLAWALSRMGEALRAASPDQRAAIAYGEAAAICEEDVAACQAIGVHGAGLIAQAAQVKGDGRVNILTHCNAGWLACVDHGTALAPIYHAHDAGVHLHVWVDETRPRNQGAALTAFELGAHGVPHTVIADNAGGHLMQRGEVDLCIVGADRITARGDVANKIGTYLKALAAREAGVPFHVAAPLSTIDWSAQDGLRDIPIEERSGREVTHVTGLGPDGALTTVQVAAPGSGAANPGFDVTPAGLVSGLITECGLTPATAEGLSRLRQRAPA